MNAALGAQLGSPVLKPPLQINVNMEPIAYSLNDVAVLVKRHSHDVRNILNGMELEMTLLEETNTTPATREAIERLREASVELNRLVQGLLAAYSLESPTSLPAIQVAELWQADVWRIASGAALNWSMRLGSESVSGEAGLLRCVLQEVLALAIRFAGKRSLQIDCRCEGGRVIFEITTSEGQANAGMVEAQQLFWTALGRLAERSQIVVEPRTLTMEGCFPMKASLPVVTVQ
jgi:signal transduction histidine kinase